MLTQLGHYDYICLVAQTYFPNFFFFFSGLVSMCPSLITPKLFSKTIEFLSVLFLAGSNTSSLLLNSYFLETIPPKLELG